jgi:hypothetical protein
MYDSRMSAKYAKLVKSLSAKGAKDPKALAAYIGRKKFGAAEFQRRAAAGRKKSGK